ncbi:MAG: molybdopterin-dependent oxidoreductase [Deferribacteres bacterium]|nr:molybdopterin-dependent oxidoreductase [candidate division KSB1 bacterium]MCB9500461.1 molybdopterin-dependent oxidoreductase [Deferribacteres bacterium]
MKNHDANLHVRGLSRFVDDFLAPDNTLHAAVKGSAIAHGAIMSIHHEKAEKHPGVRKIVLAKDVPGENQIGSIIQDEQLLADHEVHFISQPIAIVVAETPEQAREAVALIDIEYEEKPVITDPRVAAEKGQLIAPARTFSCGDTDTAWGKCDVVVSGTAASGGQEHLYLETQGCLAVLKEDGGLKLISSTQGPTAVQRIVARVLDLPMHKIEVDVLRLGGGFGGKEDQATAWATMAALAAYRVGQPVKLVLRRHEDMLMTGKRHPYSSDFKIGLTKDGKILAYEAIYYQNAGAAADLSTAILERTLFHSTNSYFIPNVKATALSCRTNLPPNTAFRGFGGPQAMFVIESAIAVAAEKMGVTPEVIQAKNLWQDGDATPYGQIMHECRIKSCWQEMAEKSNIKKLQQNVREFNANNTLVKKGFTMMPVTFGISFTNTALNQAGALVHVYNDGSVSISTGAVEMGQGVNSKLQQVAARVLGIDARRIRVDSTNTGRVANTSPTAASSGSDLNGHATRLACEQIQERLQCFASRLLDVERSKITFHDDKIWVDEMPQSLQWQELTDKAYWARVSLSAQAHYSTPNIHFDKNKEKGHPFAYYAYGVAATVVRLDCIRGTYKVESVDIVHDLGSSLSPKVDLGQIEGALMQGIGWMMMEDVVFSEQGRLLANTLSTYKIPDIYFAPESLRVHILENADHPAGLFHSKAIGEPPFMYGIGAWFALREAMKAYRQDVDVPFVAPFTPESVLMRIS